MYITLTTIACQSRKWEEIYRLFEWRAHSNRFEWARSLEVRSIPEKTMRMNLMCLFANSTIAIIVPLWFYWSDSRCHATSWPALRRYWTYIIPARKKSINKWSADLRWKWSGGENCPFLKGVRAQLIASGLTQWDMRYGTPRITLMEKDTGTRRTWKRQRQWPY